MKTEKRSTDELEEVVLWAAETIKRGAKLLNHAKAGAHTIEGRVRNFRRETSSRDQPRERHAGG